MVGELTLLLIYRSSVLKPKNFHEGMVMMPRYFTALKFEETINVMVFQI